MTNIAYQWDADTKEYSGTVQVYESPLEPGHFPPPVNTTLNEPIQAEEGFYVYWDVDHWELRADNRGVWYKLNREPVLVSSLLDRIEPEWSRIEPAWSLDEIKAVKNAQINQWRAEANTGTFAHAGKLFSCDALSRSDIDAINGRIATRGEFPGIWVGGWKAVDNTIFPIETVLEWNDFYDSMVQQGTLNFMKSEHLKRELSYAQNEQEVAAIAWG